MSKISVIGICGNSIFMNLPHFHQKGETVVAKSSHSEIGGKGFNQAVACAKMGAEVSFLGAVGSDIDAQKCEQAAKDFGIKGCFAKKAGNTTFAVILTDNLGENRVTVYRDAELSPNDVTLFENEIKESDVLLLQNEIPNAVNEKAVEIANKYGVKVILNPAPIREIPNLIAESVFAVTPNEQEIQAINPARFKNVITTLGDKGCSINDEIFVKALPVSAVDTTGAGDTFNGVLAVCIAEGMDIKRACEYAVTASGLSVTKKGVLESIPTRNEIERKMKNE